MILVDTGPLVAFFDASDNCHRECLDVLKDLDGPLLTAWPVLSEAFYLLAFSWRAQDNLWRFITRGGIEIADLGAVEIERCRVLMQKYKDLPMDLADAALVAIAEARRIKTIFTLDRRDFNLYRPLHLKGFELLPQDRP